MNKKNRFCMLVFSLFSSIIMGNSTVFHRYLWANYNHFSGNIHSARNWYKTLFASHCSSYTYKGYLNFLFDTQQYDTIIELIPSLESKFEKDPEIQLLFALTFEKNKHIDKADNHLIKISNAFKCNADITLRTAQAYLRRKEPENALMTIDTFLNNSPRRSNNFVFYFLKSQIHIQLGQLQQALDSITVCLDMHPRFDKGWLLFATLQEQHGEIKKALQGYSTFIELAGESNTVEQHLFSLMLQHKNNKQYTLFHKSYFDQAIALYNKKKYTISLIHINRYLTLQPEDYNAFILKIKILAQLHDYKQIIDTLSQQLTNDPLSVLWPKSLYLLRHDDVPKDTIIHVLETLLKTYNNNYWLSLYAADLYIRSNKLSDAMPLLEQSLNVSTDPILNAKIYHQLALLYYEKENYPDMIICLEKGYHLNSNCDYLNNSLSYYWATTGKDTKKAQYFFDKISTNSKTHPHFIDTQALIFYKQCNYTKAQKILEPLKDLNDPTILIHLAKLYYKLNAKETSLFFIEQALKHTMNSQEEKKLHKLRQLLACNE